MIANDPLQKMSQMMICILRSLEFYLSAKRNEGRAFFHLILLQKSEQFTLICTLQLYLKYSISSLELYIRFPCFMHHGELPKASAIQRRQLTISLSYIIVPVVASNPNTGMSFRLNTLIWVQSYHLICPQRWDIFQILFLQVKMSAKAGGPMTTTIGIRPVWDWRAALSVAWSTFASCSQTLTTPHVSSNLKATE